MAKQPSAIARAKMVLFEPDNSSDDLATEAGRGSPPFHILSMAFNFSGNQDSNQIRVDQSRSSGSSLLSKTFAKLENSNSNGTNCTALQSPA